MERKMRCWETIVSGSRSSDQWRLEQSVKLRPLKLRLYSQILTYVCSYPRPGTFKKIVGSLVLALQARLVISTAATPLHWIAAGRIKKKKKELSTCSLFQTVVYTSALAFVCHSKRLRYNPEGYRKSQGNAFRCWDYTLITTGVWERRTKNKLVKQCVQTINWRPLPPGHRPAQPPNRFRTGTSCLHLLCLSGGLKIYSFSSSCSLRRMRSGQV